MSGRSSGQGGNRALNSTLTMSSPKSEASSSKEDTNQVPSSEKEAKGLEQEESTENQASTSNGTKPTIGVEDEQQESKETVADNTQSGPVSGSLVGQHDWQAIYSPQHNAYYFYNTKTQETTWNNPLVPEVSPSANALSPEGGPQTSSARETATTNPPLDGIDPELAYLDPSLAYGPTATTTGAYAARFNARTGRFTAMDGRDPSHLSEYERMKRMNSVFFDQAAWEQEVAARKAQEAQEEAEGRRRRRKPTKADLVRS